MKRLAGTAEWQKTTTETDDPEAVLCLLQDLLKRTQPKNPPRRGTAGHPDYPYIGTYRNEELCS